MTEIADDVEWEPAQYTTQAHIDLRHLKVAPKGFKENPMRPRTCGKRSFNTYRGPEPDASNGKEGDADMDVDDGTAAAAQRERGAKRPRVEGAPHRKVSGKAWKIGSGRASAPRAALLGTSWDKKMADKAARAQFVEQQRAAAEELKNQKRERATRKRQALERKKANQEKSMVVQKISSATAKKMMKSKKQRKKLRTADTN